MFTNFDLVIDFALTIGNDVEGDAEIASSKVFFAVTVPRAPEPCFGVLPVVQESPNLLLDSGTASRNRLVDSGAHTGRNVGAPITFEARSPKAGDH